MFKTVTCEEELQNLIINKINKIQIFVTAEDPKEEKEVEIQINVTECNSPEISIKIWDEKDPLSLCKNNKKRLTLTCQDYNIEIKKNDNKENLLTCLWKLEK